MDECDTAAVILQCGLEKAPDLVSNMVNSVKFNFSAVSTNNAKNISYKVGLNFYSGNFAAAKHFPQMPRRFCLRFRREYFF